MYFVFTLIVFKRSIHDYIL